MFSEKDPDLVLSLENGNPNVQYQVLADENAASANESSAAWGAEDESPELYLNFILLS